MRTYKILKFSTMWSTKSLMKKVEDVLIEKDQQGWEVVSVAFGINMWMSPTAYITFKI